MTWRTDRCGRQQPDPGARPAGAGHGQAGFSLIEVLAVLLILALSAGMVLGRGPARSPALEARAAVGQLAQGLRLARARAIAGGGRVVFALDVATGAFRIGAAPPQALPRGLALTMTAVAGLTAGDRIAGIDFLPDGSSSGGRIGVAGGATRAWVGVDWLTGRVSVTDAP